jgi:hypothetical protein
MRTLERVRRMGRVGIFLPIKHSARYFPGRAAGITLTADKQARRAVHQNCSCCLLISGMQSNELCQPLGRNTTPCALN